MTTTELRLATKDAATLSPGIAMKALVYQGLGKRGWEEKILPMIQDPGDAIVRTATLRRGSKAWRALSSLVSFLEILPLQSCM